MLKASEGPLSSVYDLAMLDLDGVVYIGADAVPGAADGVRAAREKGMHCAFITNNASRTPEEVSRQLRDLGVDARPDDVVTSAQAAARLLADRCGPGASIAVLGARGLRDAVSEAGLTAVGPDDEADAVVTGYGPDVPWRDIMRVAVRIRDGLWWVASNTDLTIPTGFGIAPGHGMLVDLLKRFTQVEPVVAGKPSRPLLDETVRRVGGERPLMVGDRLDTDIEGARVAGLDSLLVMTGVTGLGELVAAVPDERPTYVAADLGGLTTVHPVPTNRGAVVELGGWSGRADGGAAQVDGAGEVDDWWRVVATLAWEHLDTTGAPVGVGGLRVPAAR